MKNKKGMEETTGKESTATTKAGQNHRQTQQKKKSNRIIRNRSKSPNRGAETESRVGGQAARQTLTLMEAATKTSEIP